MYALNNNSKHADQRGKKGRKSVISSRYIVLFICVIAGLLLVACGPNGILGYQARLTDQDGNPVDGSVNIKFTLYSYDTANSVWDDIQFEETQTVNVTDGLLSTGIGKDTTDGIPAEIFARPLQLGVEIDGETLSPQQDLYGAPYAFSLVGGAVVGSMNIDDSNVDKGVLNVVNYGNGTGLVVGVLNKTLPADIIRGCQTLNGEDCEELVFQVTALGDVNIDGSVGSPAADFAELMLVEPASREYEPGDVVVISTHSDRSVELSSQPFSTLVAGVYSTKPAVIGGRSMEDGDNEGKIPVAVMGIVPVKVSDVNGAILRGDLLTTSSITGFAMKADEYIPGTILGKALGELLSGEGVIEVLLMLR